MKRTALVTGAASGIGRACSIRLAKDGMAIGVLGRDRAACEQVAAEIRASGGTAIALAADISDRGQVGAAVDTLRAELGPITILVNSAGISEFKPFEDLTAADWQRMMDVNVIGTFTVIQLCLADMKEAQWGRIVNISSSSAQSGSALQVHYSASKGAVMSMARSLAQELGPMGITANNIAPGAVMQTRMSEQINARLGVTPEQLAQVLPVRRTGVPDDVAAACSWLVSPGAGYVTGQTIGINGGRIMS